jgi:hypothetical protein
MGIEEVKKTVETLDQEFTMDMAEAAGFDVRRGTNEYDYSDTTLTLDGMARVEAEAMDYAERKQMQTSLDPSTGMCIDWRDPNSDLAKAYRERRDRYLQEIKATNLKQSLEDGKKQGEENLKRANKEGPWGSSKK